MSSAFLSSSRSSHVTSSTALVRMGSEVVPDSEEERHEQEVEARTPVRRFAEVIEISSDEDSDNCISVTMSPRKPSTTLPQTPKKAASRPYHAFRRIIESEDEEEEHGQSKHDNEIIELTDSSTEVVLVARPIPKAKSAFREKTPIPSSDPKPYVPAIDDGIIVFDEPRSARKPVRLTNKEGESSKPRNRRLGSSEDAVSSPFGTPSSSLGGPSTVISAATPRFVKKPPATPRSNSKKALLLAKQQKLYEYAQELFADLNIAVFQEGLPVDTKLNWNKRLLTTAGRAKFHRSREGIQTTEIELAEKILDSQERIRNTLSHEMCHLATWTIDKKLDENHGQLFKKWANKITKKRPDIHVSVRHDYEISHPFQWKCEKCAKIYGRFSKSIRTDECVCGACKEGKLIPLFTTKKASSSSTPKLSKLAAAKPQDSPRAVQGSPSHCSRLNDIPSDDSDVEILAKALATTSLTH